MREKDAGAVGTYFRAETGGAFGQSVSLALLFILAAGALLAGSMLLFIW
jgi:hypothetical protein